MPTISYKICVLGETQQQAQSLLRGLVMENRAQVASYNQRDRATLADGTELFAKSAQQVRRGFDWYRFDEIFIGGTAMEYSYILKVLEILDLCCVHSVVPPEFRWWPIDDERGDYHDVLGRYP